MCKYSCASVPLFSFRRVLVTSGRYRFSWIIGGQTYWHLMAGSDYWSSWLVKIESYWCLITTNFVYLCARDRCSTDGSTDWHSLNEQWQWCKSIVWWITKMQMNKIGGEGKKTQHLDPCQSFRRRVCTIHRVNPEIPQSMIIGPPHTTFHEICKLKSLCQGHILVVDLIVEDGVYQTIALTPSGNYH